MQGHFSTQLKKKLTGGQFSRALLEISASMMLTIETKVTGFEPSDAASKKRRKRVQKDFRYFAGLYFPHYTTAKESETHAWLFKTIPAKIDRPGGTRTPVAAPRGEGKSTIISLQFLLWCALTGRKKYILLISDTYEQAAILMAAIKAELESNPRLRLDWPKDTDKGGQWKEGVVQTKGGVKIEVKGSGQSLRGRRAGAARPDLVIGDDLENDKHVQTIEQRRKLAAWWHSAVKYIGPPDGSMDIVVIGTILHYDSLLRSLFKTPRWDGKVFRAIPRMPDRLDLWDQFAEVLMAAGEDAALGFYRTRRKEMDAGAVLSWPGMQTLVGLMLERAEDPTGFACERQNEPSAGPDAIFVGCIKIWIQRPAQLTMFGAVDPSLGKKSNRGDPSAIIVGGIEPRAQPDKRTLYTLDAIIRRQKPDDIIQAVIDLQRKWGVVSWAVEAVQFQEYFRTQILKQSVAQSVPVSAWGVEPHVDKRLRIESLQPHMNQGQIMFHQDQRTLIEQFEYYPKTDHDDGPDTVHMLWVHVNERGWRNPAMMIRTPPPRRGNFNWGQY